MNTIGKILLTGALALAPKVADAGLITLSGQVDNPSFSTDALLIQHSDGAEGVDGIDREFLEGPSPAVEIYSTVPFYPYNLSRNAHKATSLTPFNVEVFGRNLSGLTPTTINFSLGTFGEEDNFVGKSIYADLYDAKNNDFLVGTYDVRALAAGTETFPTLQVDNDLSYKLNVRFDTPSDIDNDGDVDWADYQMLEDKFGENPYSGPEDIDNDGDVDWADYQILEANFGEGTYPLGGGGGNISPLSGAVPEPSTGGLVGALIVAASLTRRKRHRS